MRLKRLSFHCVIHFWRIYKIMKIIDTCVILCGGESKRLKNKNGESKIFLPFGEKSLVAYNFEKMKEIFPKVFISCKESQKDSIKKSLQNSQNSKKYDSSDIFIIESDEAFAPIFGIYNALKKLFDDFKSEKIFFISCDCPLIKPKTIDILCKNASDYDVIFAKDSKHLHHLVGVWSASMLKNLQKALQNNDFKLLDLHKVASTKSIYFEETEFLNINTKSDYKNALALLGL